MLSSIGPQDDAHAAARALGIQDFYCKWHDVFLRGSAARAPLLREVQVASGGGCGFGGRGAHGSLDLQRDTAGGEGPKCLFSPIRGLGVAATKCPVRGTLRPPELRSVVGLVEGLVECFALLGEI